MTTKVQAEFLAAGIISDQTQVSAADADHLLIFDASDNSLKKALVSTISSSSAADDITAGDAAVTISTSSGNITIDNGSSDDDIIFKGTDGGSDITALTLDMSDAGAATFNGKITADAGIDIDNFNIDGTTIALSSGNMTLDVAGNITLDSDTGIVVFSDDGTQFGFFQKESDATVFTVSGSDKDFKLKGNDGGSGFTALTIDMSEAGAATFNSTVTATQFIGDVVNGQTTENTVANDDVIAFYDTSASAIRKTAISNLPSSGGGGSSAADDITTGDAAVTIATSTGNITLDTPGDIFLDCGGGDINLKDDGTQFGSLENDGTNFIVKSERSDADLLFKVNDGGSSITALTIDSSAAGTAQFNHDIEMVDNGLLRMGAGGDLILTSDGTNGSIYANNGNLTIDVADNIFLDADGGNIGLKDAGTQWGNFANNGGDFEIDSLVQDKDIKFNGNDGGSTITALTLDMSAAGAATFNSSVTHKGSTASSASNFISSWVNTGQSYYGYLYADSGGTGIFSHSSAAIQEGIYFQNSTDKTLFYNQASARGEIDGSGNLTMVGNITAYGSTSDIRLKENIEVIDNALDKVKQLKGITYDLKSDGNRLTGLIAQDLEKVLPEAVYETTDVADDDKHLAIRYGNTVGLLVEAIKELEARVKELENK